MDVTVKYQNLRFKCRCLNVIPECCCFRSLADIRYKCINIRQTSSVTLLVGYTTSWLYYQLVILLVGYTTSCIRDNMYVSQPFTCAISFRERNNLQRKVKGQLLRNVNYLYQTVCSYSLLYYLITNNSNTRESILH